MTITADLPTNLAKHRGMKLLYLHNDAAGQDSLPLDLVQRCAQVARARSVEDALARVSRESFDAILVDLAAQGSDAQRACERLAHAVPYVPVMALVEEGGEALADDAIAAGAQDYLIKSRVDSGNLERRIRAALARRVREVTTLQERLRANLNSLQGLAQGSDASAQYLLVRGVWAAAILPSGEPDRANLTAGLSVALNRETITVEFAGRARLPAGRWIIGVEHDDGVMRFACVETTDTNAASGGSPVTARFLTDERDLFCERNLVPAFDARTHRYATRLSPAALEKWTALGVLHPQFVDRVVVCPQCNAVSTVRSGCRVCGSARLSNVKLMHHFACAHVGHVADFEREGRIICPKCRTRDLVVGADFEYVDGPFECQECSWSDANFEWVAHCLDCGLRFPIHQAVEQELIAYHVERLDPLAYLASG